MDTQKVEDEVASKRKAEEEASSEDSESDSDPEEAIDFAAQDSGSGMVAEASSKGAEGAEDENLNEVMNIDFTFCDFKEDGKDFGMTKALLGQGVYSSISSVAANMSDLADVICTQLAVGTTIRVNDEYNEGEIYSFITLLGMKHVEPNKSAKAFKEFVLTCCPTKMKPDLEKYLSSDSMNTGWLINERIINMPPQVAAPLHQALLEDVKWAGENADELKISSDYFSFERVILLAPCYLEEVSNDEKSKKKKQRLDVSNKANVRYVKYEEELLAKAAAIKFLCKLDAPDVMVDKAKGHVPQRYRPRHAMCIVCDMKVYRDLTSKMG